MVVVVGGRAVADRWTEERGRRVLVGELSSQPFAAAGVVAVDALDGDVDGEEVEGGRRWRAQQERAAVALLCLLQSGGEVGQACLPPLMLNISR